MKKLFIVALFFLIFSCKREEPVIPDNKNYIYENSHFTVNYKDWMVFSLSDTLKYLSNSNDTIRFLATDSTTIFGDTTSPAMTINNGDTTLTYHVRDYSHIRFNSDNGFITFGLFSEVYKQTLLHNVLSFHLFIHSGPAMVCGLIEVPISTSPDFYITPCGDYFAYYESMEINGEEYNDVCSLLSGSYTNTSAYFSPVEGFIQFTVLGEEYNKIE
jgi:hypothetical protein